MSVPNLFRAWFAAAHDIGLSGRHVFLRDAEPAEFM